MIEWTGLLFLIIALSFVGYMLYSWDKEIPPK